MPSYSDPRPCTLIGVIVLLFQALLLAHGGITTLGANTFSMEVLSDHLLPLVCLRYVRNCRRRKRGSILAASLADLGTYLVTSVVQLLWHIHLPAEDLWDLSWSFMTVFALTQIPLAIIEGLFGGSYRQGAGSLRGAGAGRVGIFESCRR